MSNDDRSELSELRRRVAELEDAQALLKRTERKVEEALEYAEAIIETVREPILVLDPGLRVRTANRSFYDTFRVAPRETVGRLLYELGSRQWDIPRLRELLEEILPHDSRFEGFEVEHEFPSIGRKVMLLNAKKIDRADPADSAILLAFEDATERRRTEQHLVEAAITDPMTGLYNRRGLFALAGKLFGLFQRERRRFTLFVLDLDGLKRINDRFGHEQGDRMLVETARILRETFRQSDILARVGGDEFVVVPVSLPAEDAAQAESRLLAAVEAFNRESGLPFALSVSIGISSREADSERTLEDLLADGDRAMYRRKRRGTDQSG